MRARIVTALLCLVALFTELTLDSSTSFVRENPLSSVGRLVIVKSPPAAKKLSLSFLPDASSNSSDYGVPHGDGIDLLKFGSAASHAAQVVVPVTLSVLVPIGRYVPEFEFLRIEPHLSSLQRPPSV